MSFLGSVGNGLKSLANTAVQASPYALAAVRQQQAQDEADKQRALAQLHQINQDNSQSVRDTMAYIANGANVARTNAQTAKLQEPTPSGVTYKTDANGNFVALPSKVTGQQPVTPMQTGVSAPPRPAPRVDPNSDVGIAAAGKRAGAVAAAKAPYAAPKIPPLVKTVGPDGSTIYTPAPQAAGMTAPTTTPGGGSASLSSDDRNRMLQQAKLDNQTMKDYEAKVLSGQKKVGTVAGVAGAAASGSGSGVTGNILGVLGNAATGALDPEYQKYITAQRSYGRIMGNLQSKRYTDHQAEIERSISGLQGNDLNGTIQYKQNLRDASLADALGPSNVPAAPGGRGRGGAPPNVAHPANTHDTPGNVNLGASSLQQKYEAAVAHLKAQGKSDAEIAKILPPPEDE